MSSLFGTQAERLLRENWTGAHGAQMLSEELFAIFNAILPLDQKQDISLTNDGSVNPKINLNNFKNGDTIFQINQPGQAPVNITLNDIKRLGDVVNNLQNIDQQPFFPPLTLMGLVVSGGPGHGPYLMQLDNNTQVVAFQQQIADDETIPAGTAAVLIRSGQGFLMQVPVWM